ncbi:uncharacterized protein klhdc3l isoform X2 [Channa argus]|uniref:uncharacterized protein klhdc3l isoform X2 n=1 Tax=Channa argus TaxID=215402 RepID=UPI0035214D66
MPAMIQSGNSLWTQPPQSGPSPCDRYKHACCSYDGSVYILGGRDNRCLRDFWRYSVEKQKWVQCQGKISSPQAQMPTNRKGHSAVVIHSSMLVYGGYIDMKGSSQEFWSLDFDTMAWSQLNGSQKGSLGPGPRHSHSAMVYQDCMYLFGGLKGLQEQRDFWKWNSTSTMWTSLRNKSGPSRLVGHSAVAYKDSMLLFGGGESQDSPKNCLWRYSFSTQTWGQVSTHPGSNPPNKIHHCCTGLGPSYKSNTSDPTSSSKLNDRLRPFKNKCFPAPLTFLGSEVAIELETFSPQHCYDSNTPPNCSKLEKSKQGRVENNHQQSEDCLTFENRAFRKQQSCTDGDLLHEVEEDISMHLPDVLLVLGGRPCTGHSPISIWHMTLTES